MKNIKKVIHEVLEIQKGVSKISDLDSNTTALLLVGYCSVSNISDKVNLNEILNSDDIKVSVKEALDIIDKEVEEIRGAVSYLNNLKLSSEEIAKIIVVLKSSLFNAEQYKEAFEYMLESILELSAKKVGETTTPNFINKLAVQIVEPKEGEFYDGAFGIGGTAIEANYFANSYGNELKIYGQELNLKTYCIACIRMFINGIKSTDIRIGDVLANPIFKDGETTIKKFDSIIMNPPFSITWRNKEKEILNDKYARFIYGTPNVSSADWLFVSITLKSLKEKGKAVVITTLGALFRAGAEETLRKKIIGFDHIECIIELAKGLFMGTSIPCALIVFNMNKSEDMKNKMQFINAGEIYENARRGKNILNYENINTILDIYKNKKIVENISSIVDLQDIHDGNLLPSKHVVKNEFKSLHYGKVKINLDRLNSTKTLGNIGSFYRGINVTSKNVQNPNGNYKIINFADIKNGKLDVDSIPRYSIENNARVEAYKVEAGDIIISNKGATKICIIPKHEGNVLISQNFIGIRLKSGYNAQYIKEFLESPVGEYLIDSRKVGTMVTMINIKDLKEIPIVSKTIEEQNQIMNTYKEKEKRLNKEMEKILKEINDLKFSLYKEMDIKNVFEIM
ncbi:N-6 DNA methylase [Clostridium botulinum]|uniref:N-6 DNA methylase n=2 Tax=Clostridium botulinum TaxID=1491 RepID=UPI0005860E1D|nr:N-6 DNA methylase [Clostridium botulinum]AJD26561.1 N-6 DNA Methylase family protein [Clostridium botulinum CDC_297]MBY6877201.1 N-6 DNA methylase [Clostridium botulinum]MBY6890948.1 N-6 DNA methylase [Clostridium botulinum]MBY6894686.1 N-6 DNA methylase [Clostridium botulinum]MBY6901422.1 N-6 DNA methylase [Clostridium botulinum]